LDRVSFVGSVCPCVTLSWWFQIFRHVIVWRWRSTYVCSCLRQRKGVLTFLSFSLVCHIILPVQVLWLIQLTFSSCGLIVL